MKNQINETTEIGDVLAAAEVQNLMRFTNRRSVTSTGPNGLLGRYPDISRLRIGQSWALYAPDILAAGLDMIGQRPEGQAGRPNSLAGITADQFSEDYHDLMGSIRAERTGSIGVWVPSSEAVRILDASRQTLLNRAALIRTIDFGGITLYSLEDLGDLNLARTGSSSHTSAGD